MRGYICIKKAKYWMLYRLYSNGEQEVWGCVFESVWVSECAQVKGFNAIHWHSNRHDVDVAVNIHSFIVHEIWSSTEVHISSSSKKMAQCKLTFQDITASIYNIAQNYMTKNPITYSVFRRHTMYCTAVHNIRYVTTTTTECNRFYGSISIWNL